MVISEGLVQYNDADEESSSDQNGDVTIRVDSLQDRNNSDHNNIVGDYGIELFTPEAEAAKERGYQIRENEVEETRLLFFLSDVEEPSAETVVESAFIDHNLFSSSFVMDGITNNYHTSYSFHFPLYIVLLLVLGMLVGYIGAKIIRSISRKE